MVYMTHKSQSVSGEQSPPENEIKAWMSHETSNCIFLQYTERDENRKKHNSLISRNVGCFRQNDAASLIH